MEEKNKYIKVRDYCYNRVVFTCRISGLKSVFSDVKENKWISIVTTVWQVLCLFMCLDLMRYSMRFNEKEKLMNLVGNCLAIIFGLIGLAVTVCMKKNTVAVKNLFQELLKMHEANFEDLQPIFNKHFTKEMEFCKFMYKILYTACWIAFIAFVTFGTLFSYYFDHNCYPLPIFYEIIILPPTGPISYAINWITQIIVVSMTFTNFVSGSSSVIYAISAVGALIDTTAEIAIEIKAISEQIGFEGWLKTVLESVNSSKRLLTTIRAITKFIFYLIEKTCYAAIFVSWVIWHIDPTQAYLAVGALCAVFSMLLVVIVNEIMLDKFDDLATAVYDTPWHELNAKKMKDIIILIQTAQNPISLSSAGLSDITYEWFADLIKSGYSAGLVLQDLVAV